MNRINGLWKDQKGITGLETAIILIAFIVVAAVFAFTVMTTGLFSTEKAKTTAQAGIAEASSTFAPKGGLIAECAQNAQNACTHVDALTFQITTASGSTGTSIAPDKIALIYSDDNQRDATNADINGRLPADGILSTVTITKIVASAANAPELLQQGDVAEIRVELNTTAGAATLLGNNALFRLEIIPQQGGSLILSRKTPPELMPVMNLE
ncbi:MAG: archaellin/type IV pilin N-terminal domain-containing protein [Dehalococcoidia bacterium]